jgi:hypothetical protein
MSSGVGELHSLLSGGDRRDIADSNLARSLLERAPARVAELADLAGDEDPLIAQRALDLLEKLAHEHPDWVEPHKRIFIGPIRESDRWEIRLQIVRALPLFRWTARDMKRVEAILLENVTFPQTFVRAWALDSLATLSVLRPKLAPVVQRHLRAFERSPSKALQARARHIRDRLAPRAKKAGRPRQAN